jgi:ribosomal protein L13E
MVYLGTVVERRRRERENNLRDLLKKALKEYSDYVKDPSKIFLLGN